MAKPTVLPEFATSDLVDPTTSENNVSEPIASAKQYGWTPYLTVPFRQWMNWIHRHTHLWLKYIDDELEPAVAQNASDIGDNAVDINTNASDIGDNATDIATNVSDISTNVTDIGDNAVAINGNTSDIGDNATDIGTNTGNISTNTGNISTNTGNISTNTSAIAAIPNNGVAFGKITTSYLTVEQSSIAIGWTEHGGNVRIGYLVISGTSNSTTLRIDPETVWPSNIVSAWGSLILVPVIDNGNIRLGAISPPGTSSGQFVLYNADASGNLAAGNFTGSGTKGLQMTTFYYRN